MNYKRETVKKHINNNYEQVKRDISKCSKISNLRSVFNMEYDDMKMYCESVIEEISIDVQREVLQAKGRDAVDEVRRNIEHISVDIKPIVLIDDEICIENKEITNQDRINQSKKSQMSTISPILGFIAGGATGAMIQKSIVTTMIGGAVGVAIGLGVSILTNDSSEKKSTVPSDVKSVNVVVKEINKKRVINIAEERRKLVLNEIMEKIDKIEEIHHRAIRG